MTIVDRSPKVDQPQVDALLDRAYDIRGEDIHESIRLANEALTQCDDIDYPLGTAKAKNHLSLFYLVQGEFELARELATSALEFFTETHNRKGIADAHYNLGSIFYRTNDYHKGLQLMLKCSELYRELNDLRNQARVLIPIGTIYEYFGDYNHATKVYKECIEISREIKDLNLESNAYNPLSGIYIKQNELDKAFDLVEKSISIKSITGDKRGLAFALYTRGKVHLRKKYFEAALRDFNTALTMTTEANDRLGQGMVLNKIGNTYLELNDLTEARIHFLKAEDVSKRFNVTFVLARAHYNLYLLSKAEHKPAEALAYYEQSIKMKDSVVNKETFNIINSYDNILKIELLERETRLQKEKSSIIEQKNAELDSFFYRVSHDLKGPISSLLGLHNLVEMEIRDNAALKLFDLYDGQVRRMNNIVMGLINLTAIKNTKELKVRIDFERLVQECVQSCFYLDRSSEVIVTKEIQPVEYYSEWAIINTILQNLIENAIKYSRGEVRPLVDIKTFVEGDQLVIRVEDNGQGIPENHLSSIFDMFYRANNKVKGSGLGLYILKRAVERLQGTVKVKSTLNVGSEFTVTLPLNP